MKKSIPPPVVAKPIAAKPSAAPGIKEVMRALSEIKCDVKKMKCASEKSQHTQDLLLKGQHFILHFLHDLTECAWRDQEKLKSLSGQIQKTTTELKAAVDANQPR